jgi:hypothetical protein
VATEPNLASTALSSILGTLIKDILDSSKKLAKSEYDKLMVELEVGFTQFLDRNYKLHKNVKTFLNKSEPVDIRKAHVETDLIFSNSVVPYAQFYDNLKRQRYVIITGIAGSGKTMFMKHLFVTLYENSIAKIPILVELRRLNQQTSILEYVYTQISDIIPSFNRNQFDYSLRAGKFILLLDGFDELSHEYRDQFCEEIVHDLYYKYYNLIIVISSRPNDKFSAWDEFHVGKIAPLNRDQITDLVSRQEFEEAIKKNFLNGLDKGLDNTHRQLVSNPLLCTLMLMTYDQFAELPAKMHIYYERAFDVLFMKHDAVKSGYWRKFYTGLKIDEVKRVMSTFCLLSFLDDSAAMSEKTALGYADRALKLEEFKEDPRDFLADLVESVCVLLRDGLDYSFIHRSFQEYFVALFLAERQSPGVKVLIDRIVNQYGNYNVVGLLFELNRDLFETKYFGDQLLECRQLVSHVDLQKDPGKLLKLAVDKIIVREAIIALPERPTKSDETEFSTLCKNNRPKARIDTFFGSKYPIIKILYTFYFGNFSELEEMCDSSNFINFNWSTTRAARISEETPSRVLKLITREIDEYPPELVTKTDRLRVLLQRLVDNIAEGERIVSVRARTKDIFLEGLLEGKDTSNWVKS